MARRPLFTPTRAVIGLVLLAALVVGGLAWVSVAALDVEAAERQAAAQADVSKRERLALWRLDSHLLSPLAVENNRPFNNYLALAPPASVVLDATWLPVGDPGRVPSPLLSAPLPDWMLLHFQLDPAGGWGSPQVLPPAVVANLRGEPLDLPIPNCTQARVHLLDDLRVKLPADPTLRALADLDRGDPDTTPFAVPVSLPDEPGVWKLAPPILIDAVRPADGEKQADAVDPNWQALKDEFLLRAAEARAYRYTRELGQKAQDQPKADEKREPTADAPSRLEAASGKMGDAKESEAKPSEAKKLPAPDPFNFPATNSAPTLNMTNPRANNTGDAGLRRDAADRVQASRGAYDTQLGGRGGQAQTPGGGGVQAAPRKEADKDEAGRSTPTKETLEEKAKELKKANPAGGMGGVSAPTPPITTTPADPKTPAPSQAPGGPPGASTSPPPAVQPSLAEPQKFAEDQYHNTVEWTERVAKLMQDRNRMPSGKTLNEQPEDFAKQQRGEPGRSKGGKGDGNSDGKDAKPADGGKLEKLVATPFVAAAKSGGEWDSPFGSAAEPKPPPVVSLVPVQLGALRPRWLTAADGTEHLLLVRAAALDNRVVYQGVVADWPTLHRTLTDLVTTDLFPNAKLVPLRDAADAPPERTMTTLPVRLDTGADPACGDCGWTPLRFGLVIAWAAAVLAIVATAVGGRAVLAMSARRVRFASAVTHELRTPLTALQLHLDLLTSGLITDEAKKAEYLATLAAEADRLNRLVENVLDFARLEKPTALGNARPVPVADLLDSVRRTWADRLHAEGFELLVESTTPPEQTVAADPRVLEQVLGNLIDNARKYAKGAADKRILVRASVAGTRVAVEVEDRGPGVPAGERRLIFKPFARGSGATDTGGAGLGLSLAKEWADLFGGSLAYRPADGGTGACFRLELPG